MTNKTATVLYFLILHFHFPAPPIALLLSVVTKLRPSYHCLSHLRLSVWHFISFPAGTTWEKNRTNMQRNTSFKQCLNWKTEGIPTLFLVCFFFPFPSFPLSFSLLFSPLSSFLSLRLLFFILFYFPTLSLLPSLPYLSFLIPAVFL